MAACCFDCDRNNVSVVDQCVLCGVHVCDTCWDKNKWVNRAWDECERACAECVRCDLYDFNDKMGGKTADDIYLLPIAPSAPAVHAVVNVNPLAINFRHPIEELYWVAQHGGTLNENNLYDNQ